jgi:hypothetical protein
MHFSWNCLEHRTEKHGSAKAELRSGFRANPMLEETAVPANLSVERRG